MRNLAKVRQWANRDDGKYYRVGNRSLNWLEVIGALLLLGSLVFSQICTTLGINGYWLVMLAAIGFLVLLVGSVKSGREAGT